MNKYLEFFPLPLKTNFYYGHLHNLMAKLSFGFLNSNLERYEHDNRLDIAGQFLNFLTNRFETSFTDLKDEGFKEIFKVVDGENPQVIIDPTAAFRTTDMGLSKSQYGVAAVARLCAKITKEFGGKVVHDDNGTHYILFTAKGELSTSAQLDAVQKAVLIDNNFESSNVAVQQLVVLRNGKLTPEKVMNMDERKEPIDIQRGRFLKMLKAREKSGTLESLER